MFVIFTFVPNSTCISNDLLITTMKLGDEVFTRHLLTKNKGKQQ
jgi:hypothetical protein